MNRLVLSGANTIVLWGACLSCYQAHGKDLSHCQSIEILNLNSSNYKTLGLPLTFEVLWIAAAHVFNSPQMAISDELRQRAAP